MANRLSEILTRRLETMRERAKNAQSWEEYKKWQRKVFRLEERFSNLPQEKIIRRMAKVMYGGI